MTDEGPKFYRLDPEIGNGHVPIPCDMEHWSSTYEETMGSRRVGEDWVGEYHVSTMFMGLCHQHDPFNSRPILFETMVFLDDNEVPGLTRRESTWEGAEIDHKETIDLLELRVHGEG